MLYAIEGHINAQGEARLALATIAHEAGIGERWARRLIARLRSADLLLVEYPIGQVPCYRFPVTVERVDTPSLNTPLESPFLIRKGGRVNTYRGGRVNTYRGGRVKRTPPVAGRRRSRRQST